tara:strand:+ start:9089 stop:10105 length:1017 start_codon:yes stop_codon:yes gene_type:complete
MKKNFIITIDVEGDNIWSRTKNIQVENSKYLSRFQNLCEKHGFKPTYLTNYEMAKNKHFVELGKSIVANNTGEIGMHLHAWSSPPEYQLVEEEYIHHPYLIEYPKEIIYKKIKYMTELLESTFEIKMVSHRAGRWAFNEYYAKVLNELGYKVDCSVTPGVSWKHHKGDPKGNGGTDYKNFPNDSYFLDLNDISQKGNSSLLEVPMTILSRNIAHPRITRIITYLENYFNSSKYAPEISKKIILGTLNRIYPHARWFRPDGNNLKSMKKVAKTTFDSNNDYLEFMLHSSELMPGGSNTFKTEESIEKLYYELDIIFGIINHNADGVTLKDYYNSKKLSD